MYQAALTAGSKLEVPCPRAQGAAGTLLLTRRHLERLLTPDEVHAGLVKIAGFKPARTSDDEIVVFDSSGTSLQDLAAAAAAYRRAHEHREGVRFSLNA